MKQSNFKVKIWGELSQKNNPLNQIKVYSQEYEFIVNLTKIIELNSEPLRLL